MNAITPEAFTFETARLHMRPLDERDEALFCGLYTDPETMRYIGPPLTPERAVRRFRKTIASWHDNPLERAFFAIIDRADACSLGLCAISRFEAQMSRAEIGIMLLPGASGQGYARESLGALVRETLDRFPVDELWVECSARNPVVERMVSSIGFRLRDPVDNGSGPLAQRVWTVQRALCFTHNNQQPRSMHVQRD